MRADDPLAASRLARLMAWAEERFPLSSVAVLFVVYLAVILLGRAVTHPGHSSLLLADMGAFAGVLAFYLMLRIFDDHKDFERDRVVHPNRLLQRGVVTLHELKGLAVVAVGVQIVVCLLVDRGLGPVALWWGVTMIWTVLAAEDFFVGHSTADHPVLHPMLHVPVSALAFLWMAQIGAGSRAMPVLPACLLAVLGLLLSAVFDIARKFVPDDSAGTSDRSYTAALGSRKACLLLGAGLVAESATVVALLLITVEHWFLPVGVVVLALVLALVELARCARPATQCTGEAGNGALTAVLVQLCTVIAALVAAKGAG